MKKNGSTKANAKGREEDCQENIEHSLLCVLGADFNHFLAVGDGSLRYTLKLDVGLDELHRAVGAGGHGLGGCAGEPVNHGATGDQAEHERRVQQRKIVHVRGEPVGERHDDGENHGGGADHRGPDQHRLGRGFESVARAVVFFQQILGALKVYVHVEVFLEFLPDVGDLLDQRQFIHGLRVVGHRTVGVHRDGHRAHAQEAERHQSEGEDRGGNHQIVQTHGAEVVADRHQRHHRKPEIVGGEISRHEAGQNAQRRAALVRRK